MTKKNPKPPQKSKEIKHSLIGASSAYRWTVCHGSPRLIAEAPQQKSSVYAEEGTAAHELAEVCLTTGNNPARYLGSEVHGFPVTEEMVEAVDIYVQTVRSDQDRLNGTLLIEQSFDLSEVFLGLFGRNDAIVYQNLGRLIVYDYKHGAGNAVEVVENKQLLYYALGAVLSFGKEADFEEVELAIVQPRAAHRDGPVRRWVISVNDVIEFGAYLKDAAKRTQDPDAKLVAGGHCKYCPAIAICPAIAAKAQEIALADFPAGEPPAPMFPAPSQLSPLQIKNALTMADMISDWIKGVQAFAEESARRGVQIPGFKLVKKRANRKWMDEKTVVESLEPIYGDKIFEPRSILSPAQMEKACGKDGKMIIETLVITPDAGICLVEEADKRDAVDPSLLTDFAGQ